MAITYYKATTLGIDETLILDPREAFHQPFDVGAGWTEIRIGFLISHTPWNNDNGGQLAETAGGGTSTERYWFGIKDSSQILPGVAGSIFFGSGVSGGVTLPAASGAGTAARMQYTYNGTTAAFGIASNGICLSPPDPTGTSNFAAYVGCRISITDRGGPTQAINVAGVNTNTAYTDSSETAMRVRLLDGVHGGAIAAAVWHDSGVPRPIPDYLFARTPFVTNRMRIHAAIVEKFA